MPWNAKALAPAAKEKAEGVAAAVFLDSSEEEEEEAQQSGAAERGTETVLPPPPPPPPAPLPSAASTYGLSDLRRATGAASATRVPARAATRETSPAAGSAWPAAALGAARTRGMKGQGEHDDEDDDFSTSLSLAK